LPELGTVLNQRIAGRVESSFADNDDTVVTFGMFRVVRPPVRLFLQRLESNQSLGGVASEIESSLWRSKSVKYRSSSVKLTDMAWE